MSMSSSPPLPMVRRELLRMDPILRRTTSLGPANQSPLTLAALGEEGFIPVKDPVPVVPDAPRLCVSTCG